MAQSEQSIATRLLEGNETAFERLLGPLERCEETGAPLDGWVATIARNLAINRLAKHGSGRGEPRLRFPPLPKLGYSPAFYGPMFPTVAVEVRYT